MLYLIYIICLSIYCCTHKYLFIHIIYIFVYADKGFFGRFGSVIRHPKLGKIVKPKIIGHSATGTGSINAAYNPVIRPTNVGKIGRTAAVGGACGYMLSTSEYWLIYGIINNWLSVQQIFKDINENIKLASSEDHWQKKKPLFDPINKLRKIMNDTITTAVCYNFFHPEYKWFTNDSKERPVHDINMKQNDVVQWDEILYEQEQEQLQNNNNNNNNNDEQKTKAMDLSDEDEEDMKQQCKPSEAPMNIGPFPRGKIIAGRRSFGGDWQKENKKRQQNKSDNNDNNINNNNNNDNNYDDDDDDEVVWPMHYDRENDKYIPIPKSYMKGNK